MFVAVGDPTVYVSTGSAYSPNENFPLASGNVQGLDYDGTVFWSHDAPGYKLSFHKLTSYSSLWWVSNTWYDSNATGATHETAQGPRKSFTMKKRARLQVTTGLLPVRPIPNTTDDPVATRLYLGRGAADPGRTSMERAATLADGLRNGIILTHTFPAAGAAINPPPAASDFPASSPGRIISADGASVIINGDGTFTFGSIARDVAGGSTKLAGITVEDTGWVNVTLKSGFTAGGGLTPQVRRINGVVYGRGYVSGTGITAGSFVEVAILPAGFWPSSGLGFAAGSNTATAMSMSLQSNGSLQCYCSATTAAWFGLSNMVYPLG
jgi:hypothetical protein